MFLVPMTRSSTDLARSLDRLFDEGFDRLFAAPSNESAGSTSRSPALDVAESDHAYTVRLDLPGVAKEDVQVSVEGRRVSVQAQVQRSDEKKDGDRIVYRERGVSAFARTFTLPMEVEQAEAAARLEQGVLTLTLPKRGAKAAARIAVA